MYLFDTVIFSYSFRGDPLVELYADELGHLGPIFLSAQSVAEVWYGAQKRSWGENRLKSLSSSIAKFSVLPIDRETAILCGELKVKAEKLGRALNHADAWIMATALQYELALVTHDKDMLIGEKLGIEIVNRT